MGIFFLKNVKKHEIITCVKLSTEIEVINLYIRYILCSHFLMRSLSLQEFWRRKAQLDEENRSSERTMHRMNILESITFDVIVEMKRSN